MQVKTHVKAGGESLNSNETLVRTQGQINETLVRVPGQTKGMQVKTRIKAGRVAIAAY